MDKKDIMIVILLIVATALATALITNVLTSEPNNTDNISVNTTNTTTNNTNDNTTSNNTITKNEKKVTTHWENHSWGKVLVGSDGKVKTDAYGNSIPEKKQRTPRQIDEEAGLC